MRLTLTNLASHKERGLSSPSIERFKELAVSEASKVDLLLDHGWSVPETLALKDEDNTYPFAACRWLLQIMRVIIVVEKLLSFLPVIKLFHLLLPSLALAHLLLH